MEDVNRELTNQFTAWCATRTESAPALTKIIYEQLRQVAAAYMRHERPDHTLQATALMHEAYLRISQRVSPEWKDQGHFFTAMARAMRLILVDHARGRLNFTMGTDVALKGTGQQRQAHLANSVTYADVAQHSDDRGAQILRYFNTAAFVNPTLLPRGIYGDAGRNTISGPAPNRTDLSLMKNVMPRERLRLQLRGEAFNVSDAGRAEHFGVRCELPNYRREHGPRGLVAETSSGRKELYEAIFWTAHSCSWRDIGIYRRATDAARDYQSLACRS